jgi:hypothetical protein
MRRDIDNIVEYVVDLHNPVRDKSERDLIIEDVKQSIISSMLLFMLHKTLSVAQKKYIIDTAIQKIRKKIVSDFDAQCREKDLSPDRENFLTRMNRDLKLAEEQLTTVLL